MEDKKQEIKEPFISSPNESAFKVEQNLHDAGDPDSALIVTVHEIDEGSACNFWLKSGGKTNRILEERFLEGREPNVNQLMGEIVRFTQEKGQEVDRDLRLRLGIQGLQLEIRALIESGKKEVTSP